jgi:hypothetical protein
MSPALLRIFVVTSCGECVKSGQNLQHNLKFCQNVAPTYGGCAAFMGAATPGQTPVFPYFVGFGAAGAVFGVKFSIAQTSGSTSPGMKLRISFCRIFSPGGNLFIQPAGTIIARIRSKSVFHQPNG